MEYDLARARNIDAAPVEMCWTSRTRSFLPRPVQVSTRDRLFPLRSLRRSYGMVVRRHSIHRPSICPICPSLKEESARFRSSCASAPSTVRTPGTGRRGRTTDGPTMNRVEWR
eukprot:scaffold299873_cov43-Attheya_sp.AAC.1